MKTFEELGVSEQIRHAIEELGFEQPMPVQEEVIPYLLGTRNDVIALAQTGTGKRLLLAFPSYSVWTCVLIRRRPSCSVRRVNFVCRLQTT